MTVQLIIPPEAPVMTLSGVVFFPHAMLPLHIFEPRYRRMVEEILQGERMFCVAGQNDRLAATSGQFEPPYKISTLGVVRACQLNADGTRNLILQGLARIRIEKILEEEPYRRVRFSVLESDAGGKTPNLGRKRGQLLELLRTFRRLGGELPQDLVRFLSALEDCGTFIDTAIFSLCDDAVVKQELLETLDIAQRFARFIHHQRERNESLLLERDLKGNLDDEDIGKN